MNNPTQTIISKEDRIVDSATFQQAAMQILPVIERYLLIEYPVLSEDLQRLIARLSEQISISEDPVSKLTASGYPLELAYVWPAKSFRYTADFLPGGSPINRLHQSIQHVGQVSNPIQHKMLQQLQSWVKSFDSKYGAWVGGRCKKGKIQKKLYVEVPAKAPWQSWDVGKFASRCLFAKNVRLVMMGFTPDTGLSEFYYRMDGLNIPALRPLMEYYGISDRSSEMIEMLQELHQRHIRFEIPSSNLGFSVTIDAKQETQSFTLYTIAESLLGRDDQIIENVSNFGRQQGWDMDLYTEAISNVPIEGHDLYPTMHGMVGLVAANNGPIQFTVGWAPVTKTS